MRFLYYPGCSGSGTAREQDESLRAVAAALGIELEELADWACCGATSGHAVAGELATDLAAVNLLLAVRQAAGRKLDGLLTPCAACWHNLALAAHRLRESPELLRETARRLNAPPEELARHPPVVHILELLARPELRAKLRAAVKRPLTEFAPAAYYGCLLVRPREIALDDPEHPRKMTRLLKLLGARPVEWSHAVECCSGSLGLALKEVVLARVGELLLAASAAGANALVTACPLCQANLDLRQAEAARTGTAASAHPLAPTPLPVYFLTELVALALGLPEARRCLKRHLTPVPAALTASPPGGAR